MRSAAAVEEALDDFGARDLRQHQPRVKCVSGGRVSGADESRPTVQGFDFDIGILPGNESDICRLIEVLTITLDFNVIIPRRNVAIEGAAQLRIPSVDAVHRHLGHVERVGRKIDPVEPNPGSPSWYPRACAHVLPEGKCWRFYPPAGPLQAALRLAPLIVSYD